MTAAMDGHVLAEASDDETMVIGGNVYFPSAAVMHALLSGESPFEHCSGVNPYAHRTAHQPFW